MTKLNWGEVPAIKDLVYTKLQQKKAVEELERICQAQRVIAETRRSINNIKGTEAVCETISKAELDLESYIINLQKELY